MRSEQREQQDRPGLLNLLSSLEGLSLTLGGHTLSINLKNSNPTKAGPNSGTAPAAEGECESECHGGCYGDCLAREVALIRLLAGLYAAQRAADELVAMPAPRGDRYALRMSTIDFAGISWQVHLLGDIINCEMYGNDVKTAERMAEMIADEDL